MTAGCGGSAGIFRKRSRRSSGRRRRLVCGQRPRLCPAEPGHAQIRPPHRAGADAGCHPPPSFLREARPRSQVLLSPPEAAPGPWPGTRRLAGVVQLRKDGRKQKREAPQGASLPSCTRCRLPLSADLGGHLPHKRLRGSFAVNDGTIRNQPQK